jgi:hypothetical protein
MEQVRSFSSLVELPVSSFHFCHNEIGASPRRRDPSWACRPLLVARTRVRVDCAWPCGRGVTQRGRRWLTARGPMGPRCRQTALPTLRHASQNVKEFTGISTSAVSRMKVNTRDFSTVSHPFVFPVETNNRRFEHISELSDSPH